MKDFLLCGVLLVCLTVLVGLPVGLIAAKITGNENMLIEYISFVKAAFVAWFLSIIVLASVGNK